MGGLFACNHFKGEIMSNIILNKDELIDFISDLNRAVNGNETIVNVKESRIIYEDFNYIMIMKQKREDNSYFPYFYIPICGFKREKNAQEYVYTMNKIAERIGRDDFYYYVDINDINGHSFVEQLFPEFKFMIVDDSE